MNGIEIAELVRNSKLKWAQGSLHDEEDDSYCALGMIAHERGVSDDTLHWFENGETSQNYATLGVAEVVDSNDGSANRVNAASRIRKAIGENLVQVEKFVNYLLDHQRKRAEKAAAKAVKLAAKGAK